MAIIDACTQVRQYPLRRKLMDQRGAQQAVKRGLAVVSARMRLVRGVDAAVQVGVLLSAEGG